MIRAATLDDIPKMVELAAQMHPEGDYKNVPYNPEMYGRFLEIALPQDQYCLFVYEKDGEIVGAIMGSVFCFLFSPLLQAADMGFFVVPEHRGTLAAPLLEKAYREWAIRKGKEAGQDFIKVRLDVSTANTKAGAFYERLGYTCVGGNYSKDVFFTGVGHEA